MSKPTARPAALDAGSAPGQSLVRRVVGRLVRNAGERSAEAVGGLYAQAARSLLTRIERLQDLNAERRHQLRSRPRANGASATPKPPSIKPTFPQSN